MIVEKRCDHSVDRESRIHSPFYYGDNVHELRHTIQGEKVSFDRRENIILTVGRLGTGQKKTEVLLEAFAKIADEIVKYSLYTLVAIDNTRGIDSSILLVKLESFK